MVQRVELFGKTFCVPKGLKVEQGSGFCRVVADPDYIKKQTVDNLKRETRPEKILSMSVIEEHYDDFISSSSKPGFDMKTWLLNNLPQGCDKEWVEKGYCKLKGDEPNGG